VQNKNVKIDVYIEIVAWVVVEADSSDNSPDWALCEWLVYCRSCSIHCW